MSIRADDKDVIHAALVRAAGSSADATAIAEAAASCWQAVVSQLEPVVGQGGVHALYGRCLHLRGIAGRDSLAPPADGPSFLSVRSHLERQSPDEALAAATEFFHCFSALLGSLIGAGLTARLLSPVWADGPPDVPAPENER